MRRYVLAALFLIFISSGTFSENVRKSYLCIAEKGSAVVKESDGGFNSYASEANNKYVVTPSNGLRHFGIDANWLSDCIYNAIGKPTWCERAGAGWAGVFMMDDENTFVVNSMNPTADMKGIEHYTVIGRCSEL